MILDAIVLVLSYLLGSLPFGVWIGRWWKKTDIRAYGSGNTGTTNALRVLGPWGALPVLIGDVGKAALAVALARWATGGGAVLMRAWGGTGDLPSWAGSWLPMLSAIAAVLGHNWSIFLRFRGGKGVASTFGAWLVLNPWPTVLIFLLWLAVVWSTRYVSVGSLTSALAWPFVLVGWPSPGVQVIGAGILTILAFYRHWPNLQRLWEGTEHSFHL